MFIIIFGSLQLFGARRITSSCTSKYVNYCSNSKKTYSVIYASLLFSLFYSSVSEAPGPISPEGRWFETTYGYFAKQNDNAVGTYDGSFPILFDFETINDKMLSPI